MKIKNILVSQPEPADFEKSPYSQLKKTYKLNFEFRKFIKIEGVSSKEFRQSKIHILDHTAVILTSRHAVDNFFTLSEKLRLEIPDSMKYYCISESTAYYLQKYVQYRKRKIFHANQSVAQLVDLIKKNGDEKYLLPSSGSRKPIQIMLDKEKVKYTEAVMYKTLPNDLSDLKIDNYDLLIFFSPSGVESLFENFPEYKQGPTLVAGFGPSTLKAIKKAGMRTDIEAPTKTAPSMTMALDQFLRNTIKK